MTDTTVVEGEAQVTGAEPEAAEGTILSIPCVKGKKSVDIHTAKLPESVYREALMQGLKQILNRGMTKITKAAYPVAAELEAAAMAAAALTVEAMYAGKTKIMMTGAKVAKASGAVMTEARRIARNIIKDELKAQKIKISHVAAKDITAAANALIAENPDLIKQAEASLAAATEKRTKVGEAIGKLAKAIPIDAKKVAKIEADKAKAKETLSATQAGLTKKGGGKDKPAAKPTPNRPQPTA